MYVLRDNCNYNYLSAIINGKLDTTDDLSKAIILNDSNEASKLLNFCNSFENCYYADDYTIYEIDFKEVE